MRSASIITVYICLAACGGPSTGPEQLLRQWVDDAEAAAEQKDRRGLLDMVSENYIDARGNDHAAIDRVLRVYFLRQNTVNLATKIDQVKVSGETAADIMVTVGMAATNDRGLGLSADAYKSHFELENNGDGWLLIGARWGELGDTVR